MEKFSELLATLDRGKLDDALTAEIAGIAKALAQFAAKNQKAKGAVSIKVEMVLDNGMVVIKPSFVTTSPRTPAGVGLRFLSAKGELSAHDPRQMDAFGQADTPPAALGVVRGGER